jgi:hypothetical protein
MTFLVPFFLGTFYVGETPRIEEHVKIHHRDEISKMQNVGNPVIQMTYILSKMNVQLRLPKK